MVTYTGASGYREDLKRAYTEAARLTYRPASDEARTRAAFKTLLGLLESECEPWEVCESLEDADEIIEDFECVKNIYQRKAIGLLSVQAFGHIL